MNFLPLLRAQKRFTLIEVYIQQRDATGAAKGDKIYLKKSKSPVVSSSVSQDVLLPVIQSIAIHEDMKSPSIKGRMNFMDRLNLVENLKLSPLDLLYIKMMEEETHLPPLTPPKVLDLVFSITSVAQLTQEVNASIIGPNSHAREIQLEFCSNEHYILNYSYFDYMDEDFVGPISGENGLVQYISDKVFKEKGTPFSIAKKEINADETSNYIFLKKYHNFYPWGKPTFPPLISSLMQMLIENSVDKNNPNAANFMFWQDLEGWNFRSVESIIQEYEKPVAVYKVTTNTDDPARILSFEFNIEGDVETDFLELIKDGAFGSNYLFVEPKYEQDPYARYLDTSDAHEVRQLNYEYIKDHEKWSKIEALPVLDDTEYLPNWNKNRHYDQFYGYFNSGFFNRQKKVPWEYHGYSYSNRQEETLWQTVFDITDMDGEILRKIQKEIKEPLAKFRKEYAKKMNLKEKWKVYRCSICCAGLMDSELGTTLSNALSTYEIVAAGSFTDVLNYDASTKVQGSTNPFQRSGITLSYNLSEYPYNLSLGEFFNLEENPDIFTKYRFDLEIARHQKMLEILNKNIQSRDSRIGDYDIAYSAFEEETNSKKTSCVESSCNQMDCKCPPYQTPGDYDIIKSKIDDIKESHTLLKESEQKLLSLPDAISIQTTIQKLTELKQEFEQLYESYWNRRAFFFSKDIDYSFLKSGNNLLNVKSIKRLPIRGSKYEKFATRKSFPGYTLSNGLTSSYDYLVGRESCETGETANPYYDKKYATGKRADFWASFENVYSKFPYTENEEPSKGPVWYKNYKVQYEYKQKTPVCLNVTHEATECCDIWAPIVYCNCGYPQQGFCNLQGDAAILRCDDFGEQGVDWDFIANEAAFSAACNETPKGYCIKLDNVNPENPCAINVPTYITEECCSEIAETQGIETIYYSGIDGSEQSARQKACSWYEAQGCDLGGVFSGWFNFCGSPPPFFTSGANGGNEDQGGVAGVGEPPLSGCDFSNYGEYVSSQTMHFEIFSNNKQFINSATQTQVGENDVREYALKKLLEGCSKNENCSGIEITSVTEVSEGLLHPWAADEVEANFDESDYNDYKSSASLFKDDLSSSVPPSLNLEQIESYVRVEFANPIGIHTLKDFPEGFVNTPGSEYFLPYIVLLTAGPFGAEAAKANVSVIGQDPYGFDIAVKKAKNRDDFAKMNLHGSGVGGIQSIENNLCSVFSTASSWLRHSQNLMFYRPNTKLGDIFVPMGIQDIFAASSLQRSIPVKTWWDLWVSLPPTALCAYYNRHDVTDGKFPFYEEGSLIGVPQIVGQSGKWPIFTVPDTENIATGVYPANAMITKNNDSTDSLVLEEAGDSTLITTVEPTKAINNNDPSNVKYKFAPIKNIQTLLLSDISTVVTYPVGTLIYGGAGITVGQVWKYDTSRLTEYGMVQLSSDSMPSLISLVDGLGGNSDAQKYYEWANNKLVDWYQNTIFDNNFSAQFVVFSKEGLEGCKGYPCSNPEGFVNNSNCPSSDPLCNCPCQDLRPDKITKVKDRFSGNMIPALTANFGPEPSSIELAQLKEKTKECTLIKEVLGEEWLGCVWDDPTSPYNCSCPCIGKKFYDYMKYNRTQSTFWSTPLETPLYRNAQMVLLMSNKIKITVPGDLGIKTGQIIAIDGTVGEIKKRYNGKWLVLEVERLMGTSSHVMNITLVRDSNSDLNKSYS